MAKFRLACFRYFLEKIGMTNSLTLKYKSFTFTVRKQPTNEVKTNAPVKTVAVVKHSPSPVVPKEPFQYWGFVIFLLLAVAYINGYIYWKRRSKKGV